MNRIASVRDVSSAHSATLCSISTIPTSILSRTRPHLIKYQSRSTRTRTQSYRLYSNSYNIRTVQYTTIESIIIHLLPHPSHGSPSLPLFLTSYPILFSLPFYPYPYPFSSALHYVSLIHVHMQRTHTYIHTYIHTSLLCHDDPAYCRDRTFSGLLMSMRFLSRHTVLYRNYRSRQTSTR